jgi:hypothetical protein
MSSKQPISADSIHEPPGDIQHRIELAYVISSPQTTSQSSVPTSSPGPLPASAPENNPKTLPIQPAEHESSLCLPSQTSRLSSSPRPSAGLPPPRHQEATPAPAEQPAGQSTLHRRLKSDSLGPKYIATTAHGSSASLCSVPGKDDLDSAHESRVTPIPEPSTGTTFKSQRGSAIRFPTRWNPEDKHRGLDLSTDGYEVRYCICLSRPYFPFSSRFT